MHNFVHRVCSDLRRRQVQILNFAVFPRQGLGNDLHALVANFVLFKHKLLQTGDLAKELHDQVGRLETMPLLLSLIVFAE